MHRDQQIEDAVEYLGKTYRITSANHRDYKALIFIQNELKDSRYNGKAIRSAIDEVIEQSPQFMPTIAQIMAILKANTTQEELLGIDAEDQTMMSCFFSELKNLIDEGKVDIPLDPMIIIKTEVYNMHVRYLQSLGKCNKYKLINPDKDSDAMRKATPGYTYRHEVYNKVSLYCSTKNLLNSKADKDYKPTAANPGILDGFSMKEVQSIDKEYTDKLMLLVQDN